MKQLLMLFLVMYIGPSYSLPNPASIYCIKHGGTLTLTGNLSGICLFPNRSYCEEWSYFRGDCKTGEFFLPKKKENFHYCVKHSIKKNPIVYLCKKN